MSRGLFLILLIFLVSNMKGQQDCSSAIPLCSQADFSYSSSGVGAEYEGFPGCAHENHSAWYVFTIATPGTLTFSLTPSYNFINLDWSVYGPAYTCGSAMSPIRCRLQRPFQIFLAQLSRA